MKVACADRGRWPDSPIICTRATGHSGLHSCAVWWPNDTDPLPDGERITDVVGDELEHGTDDEAALREAGGDGYRHDGATTPTTARMHRE